MALRCHQREAGAKARRIGQRRFVDVAFQAGRMDGRWHIAAGVLDQRHEIVGGMAALRVLEVEQAAGLYAGARRQPQEIVLVVVAQQQRVGPGRQRGEALFPGSDVVRGFFRRRRRAGRGRQIPFRQQHRRLDQRVAGIGAEPRQHGALSGPVEMHQHVGGAGVELALVAAGRQHAGIGVVAEIF